jgi:CubicO group peptidase (beta-lactamase class C family)
MLIGIAVERGEIESVNQLVYSFFPECGGRKWIDEEYDITLKDILSMSAGLDWDETTYAYTDERHDNVAINNRMTGWKKKFSDYILPAAQPFE